MPVGLPTPRHRMPSEHNTVTQMTHMYDAWGQPPPPPPPPPWAVSQSGPGGWSGNGPPPPPPPPPPPGFLVPKNIHDRDTDDSQSDEGSTGRGDPYQHPYPHQHHHHHHHHHGGIPPPPPGFPPPPHGFPYPNMWMGGIPPPPPQFHQHHHHHHHHHHQHHHPMMGIPPPPPPPPPVPRYRKQPEQVASHMRSTSASRNRNDGPEQERHQPPHQTHASTQYDDVVALQADIRSTSPSRRQIARLQRLVEAARESSNSGDGQKAVLDDEDQQELEALQQHHAKMSEKASVRQSSHKNTVREMLSEQQRGKTPKRRSKSLPHQIPTPKATVTTPRTTTTATATPTTTRPSVSRTTGVRTKRLAVSPTHTKARRSSLSTRNPAKANRNALFVQEAHQRLSKPPPTRPPRQQSPPKNKSDPLYTHASDFKQSDERVLSFLRKDVMQDNGLKKTSPRMSTLRKKESGQVGSNRPQTITSPADGRFKATERDYMEGLEDLHHKLRKTYLEIQRHPQRFLTQLTTHGTIGGDARTQHTAELFAELDVPRKPGTSPQQPVSTFSHQHPKANVQRARADMDALESQWDQLVSNYDKFSRGDD